MTWTDIAIILGTLAVVAVGLGAVQHFVPHPRREPHNDVAGFIFAAVGVTYAVLLAFVVVAVWDSIDSARQTTFNEADELAGLYWISRQLPLPLGAQVEQETLAYAHTVEDVEWPLMARHESSPAATQLVYAMRASVFSFVPADQQQQVLFDHAVTHVENLATARRQRLDEVDDSVPELLWIALISGGVLTVGFTFLFGMSNGRVHTLMVLTLTALVVISLVVVKEMDYPFAGVTRIQPTAFNVFLERLPPPR